jgi:hypothetical protein
MRNDFIDDSRGMTPDRRTHIHSHRKNADTYGQQLPFDISKPRRTKSTNVVVICPDCGRDIWVNKTTCMVECIPCKKLVSVADNKEFDNE